MGLEFIYGIGAIVLIVALAWGVIRYRQRTAAEKRHTDEATRRLHRQGG